MLYFAVNRVKSSFPVDFTSAKKHAMLARVKLVQLLYNKYAFVARAPENCPAQRIILKMKNFLATISVTKSLVVESISVKRSAILTRVDNAN